MGKTVAISADTTCDLTPELAKQYNIALLPLYITFGEDSYRDGVEITPDEIYERYEREKVLPKTAAVNIGNFVDYFKQQLEHAGRGQRERELQDAGQDRPVEHVQFFGSWIGHVLSPFP